MRWNLICGVLWASFWGAARGLGDESYHNDPISKYDRSQIEGFSVLVSDRLKDHPDEARASLNQLVSQLERIARVVPPKPLDELRKVRIWLEWDENAGMSEFHWGPDYLKKHNRNTQKSRSVEITNARHFIQWTKEQPWSVLHELAHSYHCIVLGETHPGVLHAYDQAMASHRYDLVNYIQGGKRAAYAKNNKAEYFAEATEAYFGKNDFQPFDNRELEKFDPVGYQLMVDVWGLPAIHSRN